MTLTGITDFAISEDGKQRAGLPGRPAQPSLACPAARQAGPRQRLDRAPRSRPTARQLAAVRDNDVHVVDLASGNDTPAHHRAARTWSPTAWPNSPPPRSSSALDGTWWSPDGTPPGLRGSRQHRRRKAFHRRPGTPVRPADGIPLPTRRHRQRQTPPRHRRPRRRHHHLDRLGPRHLPLRRPRRLAEARQALRWCC